MTSGRERREEARWACEQVSASGFDRRLRASHQVGRTALRQSVGERRLRLVPHDQLGSGGDGLDRLASVALR
jgi:hypothetical protein